MEFAIDADLDGQFDAGDTFQDYTDIADVLTDLDLYLVPAGTNDVGDFDILVSQSSVSPVEHFFGEIPFDGEYELWVYRNSQFVPDQNYGLAWWYGLAPEIEPPDDITGDFDADGDVDGQDFLVWQRGNSPDPLSAGDLADWQMGYGNSSLTSALRLPPSAFEMAVPEPGTTALLLAVGVLLVAREGSKNSPLKTS